MQSSDNWIVLVRITMFLASAAVLAVAVARLHTHSFLHTSEAQSYADLRHYRKALNEFVLDTGCHPLKLEDLASTTAPKYGLMAQEANGPKKKAIDPSRWKGPYLDSIRMDPITGKPFVYNINHFQVLRPGEQPHEETPMHVW